MDFTLRKGLVVINFDELYDTINHINLFNEAAKELTKYFNNSSFDFNTSTFNLLNTIIQQRCSISPGNIVIEYDNMSSLEIFHKLANYTLQVFRDNGILNKFNRIGYRTLWGLDYKSIHEANDTLIKCFNIDSKILNNFGMCDNIRYGFTSYEAGYAINYNFNSAINKEIKIFNGKQISEIENYCIIGDFDIYIDKDCKYSSIFTYMTNFSQMTKDKLGLLKSMVEGE